MDNIATFTQSHLQLKQHCLLSSRCIPSASCRHRGSQALRICFQTKRFLSGSTCCLASASTDHLSHPATIKIKIIQNIMIIVFLFLMRHNKIFTAVSLGKMMTLTFLCNRLDSRVAQVAYNEFTRLNIILLLKKCSSANSILI